MSPHVIYSRKSQEEDDKQVQSIPDQEAEMHSVASRLHLTVAERLSEARSAKAPGRPVFDALMRRVERGEVRGILCWKLDRLARNPVDGGRILWAIKQHGLVVHTPQQTFSQADDNLILMYVEFGMAQKYVDDLSRNTTRGLKSKAQKGWLPGVAPLGYLNSKVEERGCKTILRDPARFDAVRRMWDLMLTGDFSPARIQRLANQEWGFRTRQTKHTGGKPVSRSALHQLFTNPFYCGRFEYPRGSGNWYPGRHEPMVTEAEFARVQAILHRGTNPRPQREFALPYRGLLKCGECASSITAHVKEQVRCPQCRYKSSVKNHGACARCRLSLKDMKQSTIRRYAYYHCTRKRNPACRQKCISAAALDRQVTVKLKAFGLPAVLRDWGLDVLAQLRTQELAGQQQLLVERQKAHAQCVVRLENLVKLKTAPENVGGELLSDEEYQTQRAELLAQKGRLATDASALQGEVEAKARVLGEALKVMTDIAEASPEDDTVRRKELLSALGLNHVLLAKELVVKPEFPFSELPGQETRAPGNPAPIEPDYGQEKSGWIGHSDPGCPRREPLMDEDRTRRLGTALESMWKKLDPHSPGFNRHPFVTGQPVVPFRPCRKNGRFVSPETQPLKREPSDTDGLDHFAA